MATRWSIEEHEGELPRRQSQTRGTCSRIAVFLAVLAVGWSCQDEAEPDPLDAPRHERCTAMLECAERDCSGAIENAQACNLSEPPCEMDVFMERRRARTECLDTHGCNLTRCTVSADGWYFVCDDDAEQEILDLVTDERGRHDLEEACAMLEDVDR